MIIFSVYLFKHQEAIQKSRALTAVFRVACAVTPAVIEVTEECVSVIMVKTMSREAYYIVVLL